MSLRIFLRVSQQTQLGGIDLWMIARLVPEPTIKKDRPNYSKAAKESERPAPGNHRKDPRDQQRRKGAAPARTQPHDSLGPDPFYGGQPNGEGFGEVRETAGFAHPKAETAYHQGNGVPGIPGRRGEGRPHNHDAHGPLARTDEIPEPA